MFKTTHTNFPGSLLATGLPVCRKLENKVIERIRTCGPKYIPAASDASIGLRTSGFYKILLQNVFAEVISSAYFEYAIPTHKYVYPTPFIYPREAGII